MLPEMTWRSRDVSYNKVGITLKIYRIFFSFFVIIVSLSKTLTINIGH